MGSFPKNTGIGVVDPATMTWYLRNEDSPGAADAGVKPFGAPGWLPVEYCWIASSISSTPVVVDPGTMTWYLDISTPATQFPYGGVGWRPVMADWSGKGWSGLGVVDHSGVWHLSTGAFGPATADLAPFAFGLGSWIPLVGHWALAGDPLRAAGGEAPAGSVVAPLTETQLQGTVAAALARLSAAGVSPALVARLRAADYQVGALPGGLLGMAYPGANQVVVSADAAGHGGFVDATPSQDEEFAVGTPGSPLTALPGTPVAGRMDLLTAVLHEIGHLAGLSDQPGTGLSAGLMADLLAPGVCRTVALDAVFAHGL
jgi:hypothetical protein